MNKYTIEVKFQDTIIEQVYFGIKEVVDKTGYSDSTIQSWFNRNPSDTYSINGFTTIKRERKILKNGR